ncbi:MAG: hypothetical protein ACRDBG_00080, partial [Waterburya sp.]
MTAITISRQYDLTVNFFPHKPCGTNVKTNNEVTHTSNYAWIFTDATITSNPYPNFLGALLDLKLQQFLARYLRTRVLYSEVYPL